MYISLTSLKFQCYDGYLLRALQKAASDAGHPEWGHSGPDDAGAHHPSCSHSWRGWNESHITYIDLSSSSLHSLSQAHTIPDLEILAFSLMAQQTTMLLPMANSSSVSCTLRFWSACLISCTEWINNNYCLGWYSGMLLTHADTILGHATSIFSNVSVAGMLCVPTSLRIR